MQTGDGGISGDFSAPRRPVSGEWPEITPSGDPLLDELRLATRGLYEVSHCLGRGGMAAVYLARDARLKRRVAIKVMLPELRAIPTMPERFRAEAQTAAALSHPNIIVIHSVEQVGEFLFFVMSYVDGLPLDEIMRETGPLSIPLAQSLLAQVASALGYAHGEGVIHRDIKPANVMVNAKGDAVVTDFGIAKVTSATHLTQTGATIGTAAYMSPEQCMGRDITVSSDQYSLGIVAYAMLTGRLPFDGTPFEVQMKQVQEPAPDPRLLRADLPDAVAVAVLRMMAKLPADRYATIEDAARAFGADVGRSDPGARARLAELARAGSIRRSGIHQATPPGVVPRVVAPLVLAISAERTQLEVGDTLPLALHASDARTIDGTRVTWTTSDARLLDVTPDGRVVAIAEGSSAVTATYDGVSATIALHIVAATVRSIAVHPDRLTLREGETAKVDATPLDARGHPLRDRRVTWRSTSTLVASVAWTGEVSASFEGDAQVIASADGVEQPIEIVVTPAAVASVRVEPPHLSMPAGETRPLSAVVTRRDGRRLTGRELRWTTSDRKIATVQDNGDVTARKSGEVTITATCEGCAAHAEVHVLPLVTAAPLPVSPTPPQQTPARVEPLGATSAVAATTADPDVAPPSTPPPPARADFAPDAQRAAPIVAAPAVASPETPATSRRPMTYAAAVIGIVALVAAGWLVSRPNGDEATATIDSSAATRGAADGALSTSDSAREAAPPSTTEAVTSMVADSGPADSTSGPEDEAASVRRLRVEPALVAIDSGRSTPLRAVAFDAEGRRVSNAPAAWRTLTPRIVRVSPSGMVSGVASGRGRVELRVGDRTLTTEVVVAAVTSAVADAAPARDAPLPAPSPPAQPTGAAKASGAGDAVAKPPEPAPTSTGATLPVAGEPPAAAATAPTEANVRQLVAEFAAQVAGRRTAAIESVLAAATATNTRRDFLQFVSRAPGISASVARVAGGGASGTTARFTLQVSYKTVGGQPKERAVPFSASLVTAGGTWRLADVRLDEPCCR